MRGAAGVGARRQAGARRARRRRRPHGPWGLSPASAGPEAPSCPAFHPFLQTTNKPGMASPASHRITPAQEFPNGGTTNGAAWYPIYGSLQDWSYIVTGSFELTLELSPQKWPDAETLSDLWEANQKALLALPLAAVLGGCAGLSGTVEPSLAGGGGATFHAPCRPVLRPDTLPRSACSITSPHSRASTRIFLNPPTNKQKTPRTAAFEARSSAPSPYGRARCRSRCRPTSRVRQDGVDEEWGQADWCNWERWTHGMRLPVWRRRDGVAAVASKPTHPPTLPPPASRALVRRSRRHPRHRDPFSGGVGTVCEGAGSGDVRRARSCAGVRPGVAGSSRAG